MGYTTSTVHGIEVPDSAEANNVPEDIGKVVTALEGGSIVKRLTGAAIAALTSPQKPAGLVVYNTTTGRMQMSDGTNFANITIGTVQSGAAAASSSGYRDVTFATAFASAPTVVATYDTDPPDDYALYVTSVTASGFRINGLGLLAGAYWIAFGV